MRLRSFRQSSDSAIRLLAVQACVCLTYSLRNQVFDLARAAYLGSRAGLLVELPLSAMSA